MTSQGEHTVETGVDASSLTISVIAVDRPEMLDVTLHSLRETAPAGATLQLLLNCCGPRTQDLASQAIDAWQGPIRILRTETRLGFAEAHNLALAEVTTPLVNFMSDDDISFDNRLQRQLHVLDSNRDISAVGTFAYRIGGRRPDEIRRLGRMDLGPLTREECRVTLDEGKLVYFTFPSVVARVADLRAIGGLRPEFGVAADVDLWTRLAARSPVLVIPEHLFGFRIHDGSASTAQFHEARRLTRYARACARARLRGEPEPSASDAGAADDRWLRKLRLRLETESLYNFRRAGAAWLEGRRLAAAWRLFRSFVAWPPSWAGKLKEQLGRRTKR